MAAWVKRVVPVPAQVAASGPAAPVAGWVPALEPVVALEPAVPVAAQAEAAAVNGRLMR